MAPRSSPVLSIVVGILCAGLIHLTSASRPSPRDAPPSQRTLISSNTDSLANSLLASLNASGLAVAVVRQDSSVPGGWRREFGSYGIAKDDGAPVTPDTLFAIASNSKLFLAYSVGLLVSNKTLAQMRGKDLTWTTKAKDIFPEWGLMDDTASQETDIRDMLSHRIGLPSHLYALGRGSAGRAEVIANLKFLRPSAEFRQIFQYHNPGYETLARTPEVLLNQSYESYIAQHLFKPLNMSSSTFSVKEAEASGKLADGFHLDMRDQVKGVNGTRTAIIPFFARNGTERSWAGAGGVISSARDLSIWVSMLLNKGRHPETNQTVVPEEVVERCASGMTIFSAKPMYPEMSPLVYGHAQTRYSYRGHEVIEHGGGLPGFISQVTRFPNDNLAIVTLTNDYNDVILTDAVKWRIVDENLGLPEIDWSKRLYESQDAIKSAFQTRLPRPSNAQLPDALFESLEKSYSDPAYGTLQPCYANKGNSTSAFCSSVLKSSAAKRIIAAVDPNVPTFIIPFQSLTTSHLCLKHFDKNIFNVSALWTNVEDREAEGYGGKGDVLVGLDSNFELEWVNPGNAGEGLALRGGFWGGTPLQGKGEGSAEVWFKLDTNKSKCL